MYGNWKLLFYFIIIIHGKFLKKVYQAIRRIPDVTRTSIESFKIDLSDRRTCFKPLINFSFIWKPMFVSSELSFSLNSCNKAAAETGFSFQISTVWPINAFKLENVLLVSWAKNNYLDFEVKQWGPGTPKKSWGMNERVRFC